VKVFDVSFMEDIKPHELVDAIVLHTNWDKKQNELIKIIRENREKTKAAPNEGNGKPESRVE
jgi:hypothetical protein